MTEKIAANPGGCAAEFLCFKCLSGLALPGRMPVLPQRYWLHRTCGDFQPWRVPLKKYADGVRSGKIAARPEEKNYNRNACIGTIDAGVGLGQPVSYRAMRNGHRQSPLRGRGLGTVRNSNHFWFRRILRNDGIAHDCIGLALTNASPKVVPTFGRDAHPGHQSHCPAAPAGQENPFVLDMATSAVATGQG